MDLVAPSANERSDERVGTRFWIFPQAPFIPGYEKPDRIWLPILADEIWDGPSDNAMYVADPLFDKVPYGTTSLPPFDGARRAPVQPGPDRNFDNLDWNSRAFLAAHAYACVRLVLAIWQSYLGRPVRWFFGEHFERLEIVPLVDWQNAQAGYGFLELGYSLVDGVKHPYALNFDTIAHETGHLIGLSAVGGVPRGISQESDYFPLSEALSDLVSLISFLNFNSAVDRLLRRTDGNLLLHNELNRFAETSPETQIRIATNYRRMSEVTTEVHDRSLPFIGAVFDSIIDLYHRELVHTAAPSHVCSTPISGRSAWTNGPSSAATMKEAFHTRPHLFRSALVFARDTIGQAVALSLRTLDPSTVRIDQAAEAVIQRRRAGHRASRDKLRVARDLVVGVTMRRGR